MKIKDSNLLLYTFIFGLIFSYIKVLPDFYIGEVYPFLENDSFWFMYQARNLLDPALAFNFNSLYGYDLYGVLLAGLHLVTTVQIETLSFYSPAVISSLTVIPLYLIFKELGNKNIGFLAAGILFVSEFYTFRTSVGFSDTDSGIILLLFTFIYFLIKEDKVKATITAFIFHWWYLNSIILILPIIFLWACYKYYKKEDFISMYTFVLTAVVPVFGFIKVIGLGLFFLIDNKYKISSKSFYIIGIFMSIFAGKDYLFKIYNKVNYYLVEKVELKGSVIKGLINDSARVTESQTISFIETMERIGLENIYVNTFAAFGLIAIFFFSRKLFIIIIPIFILGLMSLFSGIRFIIFLEPVMAIALATILVMIYEKNKKTGLFTGLIVLALSYQHITQHYVLFLTKNHDKLTHIPAIEDFSKYIEKDSNVFLPIWHYGHNISFYSNSLVSSNGAFHTSRMNYFQTKIMLEENEELAKDKIKIYFKELREIVNEKKPIFDINKIINNLENKKNIEKVTNKKNIYLAFPIRLEAKNVMLDQGKKAILRDFKFDKLTGKDRSRHTNFNKKDLSLTSSYIKIENIGKIKYKNELLQDKDKNQVLSITEDLIITYEKNLENTLMIKLLENRSKYFEKITVNKEYILFKMKD